MCPTDAAAEVTAAPSDAIDERVESGDEESRHVNLHRTHEHRLSHRQHRKHRKVGSVDFLKSWVW